MDAGEVRKENGALNYIPEDDLRKKHEFHLPMTLEDQAEEAPTKRRRLVNKKSSGEEENKEKTPPEETTDGVGREEGPPGNSTADAGSFPPNASEAMPPRYPGGATDYPPDKTTGQSGLQHPQGEGGAEDRNGLGRGIPPMPPMGAGRGETNPQKQQELMLLQERIHQQSGMGAGQMPPGMLGGVDPGLIAARGGMFDPYLMGGQGPLPPPQGDALPYGDPSFGRGRGLDMLYPPYPPPPPLPPYGAADLARMPMQHSRGMDPLPPPPPYGEMLPNGRGFPGRGLDPFMSRGVDPYTDAILAQRYPYTAAALGGGLDRASINQEFERAQMAKHEMGMNQNPPGVVSRGLLGQAPETEIPVNPNAVTLYTPEDDEALSQYQCVVRKQIELFEAGPIDVDTNAQGRNKPISLGQVGIRCLHCSMIHPKRRSRGATYYPSKFSGFYQAAQNMASGHLCEHCPHVPEPLRRQLLILRERKSSAGGGKDYWADAIRNLGVFEDRDNGMLRFKKNNAIQEQKTSGEPEPAEEEQPGDVDPADA